MRNASSLRPFLDALHRQVRDVPASDGELLRRYIDVGDSAAFEEILRRHGPMVHGVCRNLLDNAADADDAFQATFLVLARQASAIQKLESLSSWLYGVATRVALRLRASNRIRKTTAMPETASAATCPAADFSWREAYRIVLEELAKLPDRYREPIVLCFLDGKTQDEAAKLLKLPKGTLKGRLERGRRMLRVRLERKGIAAPAAFMLFAGLGADLASATSASLHPATLELVINRASSGAISPVASALAQGVIQTMVLSKLKIGVYSLLSVAVVASSAFWFVAEHQVAAKDSRAQAAGAVALAQGGAKPGATGAPGGSDAGGDGAGLTPGGVGGAGGAGGADGGGGGLPGGAGFAGGRGLVGGGLGGGIAQPGGLGAGPFGGAPGMPGVGGGPGMMPGGDMGAPGMMMGRGGARRAGDPPAILPLDGARVKKKGADGDRAPLFYSVVQLKNLDTKTAVAEATNIAREILDELPTMAESHRTNTVLVSGSNAAVGFVAHLLWTLDVDVVLPAKAAQNLPPGGMMPGGMGGMPPGMGGGVPVAGMMLPGGMAPAGSRGAGGAGSALKGLAPSAGPSQRAKIDLLKLDVELAELKLQRAEIQTKTKNISAEEKAMNAIAVSEAQIAIRRARILLEDEMRQTPEAAGISNLGGSRQPGGSALPGGAKKGGPSTPLPGGGAK